MQPKLAGKAGNNIQRISQIFYSLRIFCSRIVIVEYLLYGGHMVLHHSKWNQYAQLGPRQVFEGLTLVIVSISLTIDFSLIHWTNITSIYPDSANKNISNLSEAKNLPPANEPDQP
jgi:hypothetical protein